MTTIRDKYPHYKWACENVPGYKTKHGNARFRMNCLKLAAENKDYAQQLIIMCSRDMLFWINTFAYTYDPRLIPKSPVVAFNTYEYQDVAFDEIKEAIETGFDELSEKSRDMGASWGYITVYTWFWMFTPYIAFRMVSRTEDLVDKTDDPDCLYWKIMFIVKKLPGWLRPAYHKTHLHLKNLDTEGTIDGCSTTGDVTRGGRCTSMLLDEFAAVPEGDAALSATRDVTTCRLFNSTHHGAGTAFFRLSKGKIRKLILHWSLHPVKQRGLYYSDKDGKLIILDPNFKGEVVVSSEKFNYPEDYPFRLDGKIRSPWYDNECDRAVHPMEIAQELDMDPFASDFQYFDGLMIEEIEKNDVRPPFLEGMLDFDEDTLDPIEFVPADGGHLKLWVHPDAYGHLPQDLSAVAGVDISAGTGASNSAVSFVNLQTGEKIAEYANPWIKPESFAKLAIALCRWFNRAFMVWDGGGPGRTFGDEIINLGYRNIYYRRNEKTISKKVSDIPGVFLNPEEKKAVFSKYRRALKDGTFVQRSKEANTECLAYIYTVGNKIIHSAAKNTQDPSGADANHGDRACADALANKGFEFLSVNVEDKVEKPETRNCFAARRKEYEDLQKQESEW